MKRLALIIALMLPGCSLLPHAPPVSTGLNLASLDACGPPTPIPPSIIARVTAQFEEGRSAPPPDMSPEDVAAYRKMEADQKTKDWPNVCRYRAANADLMKQPDSERQVVFMGDSITQNWGFAEPAYFTRGTVNRGISGQTTPQMLARFRSDVIALRPRVVHIMAGVNDIAGNTGPVTLEDIKGNLASMVELAQANNVRVVLSTVLPASKFNWAPDLRPAPQIDRLNAWIRAYAAEKRLVVADYYPALALPDGSMRPEFSLDGVHPNKAGYRAMAPITEAAIKTALGPVTLFR
ncbi:MAG: SGNH/GDSL hydrolase family protein [Hyphomonadaceae bacterium]